MFAWTVGLIGLLSFLSAVAMLLFGWWLTDLVLWATLWGSCAGIASGATVLWALRRVDRPEQAHRIQRNQARAGILFSAVAVVLIYGVMYTAKPMEKPGDETDETPAPTSQESA